MIFFFLCLGIPISVCSLGGETTKQKNKKLSLNRDFFKFLLCTEIVENHNNSKITKTKIPYLL